MEQFTATVSPTVNVLLLSSGLLLGSNHSTVGGLAVFSSVTVQVRL